MDHPATRHTMSTIFTTTIKTDPALQQVMIRKGIAQIHPRKLHCMTPWNTWISWRRVISSWTHLMQEVLSPEVVLLWLAQNLREWMLWGWIWRASWTMILIKKQLSKISPSIQAGYRRQYVTSIYQLWPMIDMEDLIKYLGIKASYSKYSLNLKSF